jgi:hypothetical protein
MLHYRPMRDYVTAAGAGRILGVSTTTVTRMAADGRLKPSGKLTGDRKNGAWLFEREYVQNVAAAFNAAAQNAPADDDDDDAG